MRVLSSQVKDHIGNKIHLEGWLYKKRLLGGLNFISLRDRHGITQIVLDNKNEVNKLKGLQVGSVLAIDGQAVSEDRAPGGVEIHQPTIEVIVPVKEEPPIEIDKPIPHKPDNLDTLFEYRVLNIRNINEQKIFKVRATLLKYLRQFLNEHDFVEINTPKLLAGASEGGAEVFKLDYFGKEATLAQSPQLYKQIMVGAYERVYEIAPAFRAEPSATTRHMSEVTMLDIEMGFIKNHDEVLDMVGDMTIYALKNTYRELSSDLASLNAPPLVLKDKVPKITVKEIHEKYSKATGTNTNNEKDLTPDEEKWISNYALKELGSDLVFATHFPAAAMKFYHRLNPDDETTVLWGDLLFRGIEIATVPMRQNDYETLKQQMTKAGMDAESPANRYYLQAFKYGLPPHGGGGFGIDRFSEKTIGLSNVKEATLFPRDINRLSP